MTAQIGFGLGATLADSAPDIPQGAKPFTLLAEKTRAAHGGPSSKQERVSLNSIAHHHGTASLTAIYLSVGSLGA